jgi:hypothetical protein
VLTLAVAGVLVVLALALGLVVQATVAHARAQAVADLAALAGARDAQRAAFGSPSGVGPCGRAAQVATHNGGFVERCAEGAQGRVSVDAAVTGSVGTAHASAVAGPRPP